MRNPPPKSQLPRQLPKQTPPPRQIRSEATAAAGERVRPLKRNQNHPPRKPSSLRKSSPSHRKHHSGPQPNTPGSKPDREKVAKNAWKIFLAEVSEEGVALIGDNDARELARRCFRLSEIFLEEEHKRA